MNAKLQVVRTSGLLVIGGWILGIGLLMFSIPGFSGISNFPLYLTQAADPRVLLMMSKDNQLYFKAYSDYTDLDGDGNIDTTYNDKFSYYGYFDSDRCYIYSSTNKRFEPTSNNVTGYKKKSPDPLYNTHKCSGEWSGNFLNWATMTRMDILRKALYGGYRTRDDAAMSSSSGGLTVLERVMIPYDAHAFVKVYKPVVANGDPNINELTQYSGLTAISLCNVTYTNVSIRSADLDTEIYPPQIRVAKGEFPRWSSGEVRECAWKSETDTGVNPANTDEAAPSELVARVQVCASIDIKEDNCKSYKNPNTTYVTLKPTGLLQTYSEKTDADAIPVRFGLMTGSYKKNKSGGILRRSIEPLVGNTTTTKNEIDLTNGKFINQNGTDQGIINTINRLRISGFKFGSNNAYNSDPPAGVSGCGLITSFSDAQCIDWANPLSEMYSEALRYLQGDNTPANNYDADDSSLGTFLKLPKVTPWIDPIPANEWCAKPSIVAISTGLNSYDGDNIASSFSSTANTNTTTVGSIQSITGNYIIGENGTNNDKRCTAKSLASLSDAKGLCPEEPVMEGTYKIAGLAYYAHTNALRSGNYANAPKVDTYSLALADSLPSFEIPVGGKLVTFLPSCESWDNNNTHPWFSCGMTELIVEQWHKDNNNNVDYGSLLVYWSDLPWGNDYDMDGVARLQFCVGDACNSTYKICDPQQTNGKPSAQAAQTCPATVAADEMQIRIIPAQAAAGYALKFGFTVSGTKDTDGIYNQVLRPGGNNFNYIGPPPGNFVNPTIPNGYDYIHDGIYKPITYTFKAGTSNAKLLKDPLWYTAKFGGYTEKDGTSGPTRDDEWATPEVDENGKIIFNKETPKNYFKVRNPSLLKSQLEKAFKDIVISAKQSSSSSVAANSVRLDSGSLIYQGLFNSSDWSGALLAYQINTANGQIITPALWRVGNTEGSTQLRNPDNRIPNADDRKIFTYDPASGTNGAGISFLWSNTGTGGHLSDIQKIALLVGLNDEYKDIPTDSAKLEEFNKAGEALLKYLRDDSSNEYDPNTNPTGSFRKRNSSLGDIVNSDPTYVSAVNFRYDQLPGDEGNSYLSFLATIKNRRPMIYIGANDGMLHAFDAGSGTDNGTEKFAYIPNLLIPELYLLADKDYAQTNTAAGTTKTKHRYFVDGPSSAGDAYIQIGNDSAEQWHTVLLGSTGAGGHEVTSGYGGGAIFALDVTNPDGFDKSKVMWEFTRETSNAGDDMGYPIGQPLIVRMHNSKWAAIFGNGYYSANQKAVLFIVDLETGKVMSKLDTQAGLALVSGVQVANGLSTPVPVDLNNDRVTDIIYAGDLLGNLWKFDVRDPSELNWKIAYQDVSSKPAPLFVAKDSSGNRQPITVQPEVTNYPNGGLILFFGTGKFFESDDNKVSNVPSDPNYSKIQTLYGIIDKNTGTNTDVISALTDLQQQAITFQGQKTFTSPITGESNTVDVRTISNQSVATNKKGWYLNLCPTNGVTTDCASREGERLASNPLLRNDRIIFTTLVPAQSSCVFGGNSWVMEMDVPTGGGLQAPIFDLNQDNSFNASDNITVTVGGTSTTAVVSALKTSDSIGIIKTPSIIGSGSAEYKYASGSALGNIAVIKEKGDDTLGRQSWRQLEIR